MLRRGTRPIYRRSSCPPNCGYRRASHTFEVRFQTHLYAFMCVLLFVLIHVSCKALDPLVSVQRVLLAWREFHWPATVPISRPTCRRPRCPPQVKDSGDPSHCSCRSLNPLVCVHRALQDCEAKTSFRFVSVCSLDPLVGVHYALRHPFSHETCQKMHMSGYTHLYADICASTSCRQARARPWRTACGRQCGAAYGPCICLV
jgi:hypothetical protein